MAAFIKIYQERNSIDDKFLKMLDDTRKLREIEYNAALKIQSAFHRFIFKKYYTELNRKATIIQKTFRMYRAKILVKCLRIEQEQEMQMKYFNMEAIKIQKAWRKFISKGRISIPQSNDGENEKVKHIYKIRKVIKKKKKNFFQD